jgi:periplasmic protein TonB
MKRNNEKVPEFDEIIFENRNKTYGAYDLRKRYKWAASLSILGGISFCALLMIAISFTPEDGTASTGPKSIVIVVSDHVIPEKVKQPEMKPPPELTREIKNLKPEVTDDTSQISSFIPITEEITNTTKNGNVNDPVIFTDTPDPVIPSENKPFIVVEEMPEYPGGDLALLRYISQNINYPYEAQKNNIQGKVILKFVVNADGSVDRIEVIRSIDPALDTEAVRVVKTLPRFKPGKQGGVPVPVWFSLPVLFKLENN